MDWTGGLTLKIIFTLFYNKTYSPVELCGNHVAFSLRTQSWNKQVRPTEIVKVFVLSNVMVLSLHMLQWRQPDLVPTTTDEVWYLVNHPAVNML